MESSSSKVKQRVGFGAKGAEGDPKPQMFNLGFGAKGAEGDPKPQMFNLKMLVQGLSARIRASAWTPLVIKVGVGLLGFFALAFVGSGAAADLLPGRAGTYLGPPTVPSAALPASVSAPSASVAASAPTPVSSGQTPGADAGAPSADAGVSTTPSAVTADGKVILNLASEEDLRKLPGVGPKKAQAIIALRTKLGKFSRPEDLLRVKGIGRKKLAKLRPRLLIDPPDKP